MPIDVDAAERFALENARLLDRHRLAVLLHGAPVAPVLAALRAYRNPDGGFAHALEPDVRGPESEPASTLRALEVLEEIGKSEDPMVADAALDFLDRAPDRARATAAVEVLRSKIGSDGSIPVPGGTEDERLTPLTLSSRPGARSRALFTDPQIEADLDRLEQGQRSDGGWMFDWLEWSPGQSVEWRGTVTVQALATLSAHRRIAV